MDTDFGRPLLKRAETALRFVFRAQRSKRDPIQGPDSRILGCNLQRSGWEPDGQERGLLQGTRKRACSQGQAYFLRLLRRRFDKPPARLEQRLQFRLVESPPIDAYLVQFSPELGAVRNGAQMEVEFRIVEIRRAYLALRDRISIHVQERLTGGPVHDSRDMLPLLGSEDSRRRLHRAV